MTTIDQHRAVLAGKRLDIFSRVFAQAFRVIRGRQRHPRALEDAQGRVDRMRAKLSGADPLQARRERVEEMQCAVRAARHRRHLKTK